MKSKPKTKEHLALADEIESWAHSHSLIDDPYLSELIRDIRNRKNLSRWSELKPMEFLPYPEIPQLRRPESLVNLITVLRNVLVFLPVALTWIAVSKATSAFSVYTNKNSIAVVNFLEFWQNGYGVLAKEWTIGRIAFLDFLLIMIVIMLTILASILGRINQRKRSLLTETIDNQRTKLALSITSYLYSKQTISPLTFDRNMANAVSSLLNAVDTLDESVNRLASKVKDLPTHRELLTEIKNIKKQIFRA